MNLPSILEAAAAGLFVLALVLLQYHDKLPRSMKHAGGVCLTSAIVLGILSKFHSGEW